MAAETTKIESLSDQLKIPGGEYQVWLTEIVAAEKELDKFKRNSRKVVKHFRAKTSEVDLNSYSSRRFNLFAANTQILQTSLLNQIPSPDVNREFDDTNDDVARVSGLILERALSYHTRKNMQFFDILKQAVQDMLVPGVGVTWHTYKAEIEERVEEPSEDMLAIDPAAKPIEYEEVVGEELVDEYVYWEDMLWSPSRVWEEVRWVARKLYLTRDQLINQFGSAGKKVSLDYSPKKTDNSIEPQNSVFQQAVVYEVWDRTKKEVIWLSKGYANVLRKKPDFLKLKNFFPCPKPLFATISNGQLIPIPDYNYAKDQYQELNEINTRISLLIKACRVVGAYDKAQATDLKNILSGASENQMVPVDQWAAFAEKGGIKGVIDWVPLDQIVATLEQLYKGREDVKQQIYEVTGMADIIRGASKASETLGAQKIKAQYASMRIQDRQKAVVYYVSEVFDIQGQLIRKHMDQSEIARMSQVQFLNEDPQVVQQAMDLLKSEDFELRCQVESESLSDIDFQAEKNDRMEFMTTITNYLKETAALMQNDPTLGPLAAQLLQFSLAGFKVGKKFEGQLDKTIQTILKNLSQPRPPQGDPEQQKAQAEIQIMEKEAQLDQQGKQRELQHKGQLQAMELRGRQQEMAVKSQERQQEAAYRAQQRQQQFAMDQQRMVQQAMNPQPHGTRNGP